MKSKLPLGKKKEAQDDEFEETDEETQSAHNEDATDSTDISEMDMEDDDAPQSKSLILKLKSKLQSLQKGKKSADAEEGEEEGDVDDEAAKKKKRSKILQGVIIGGVVVFLASDYIFPPEDEAPPVQLKPRPKPNKKPVAATDPAADPATTETPAVETPTTDTPADTAVTETPTSDTPADTAVTETPTDTSTDTATVETPDDSPVDVTSVDTSVDSGVDTSVDTTDTTFTTTDTDPVDTGIDTGTDSGLGEPGENDPGAVTSMDSVDGSETTPGSEDNLTDQILEDLEKQAKSAEPTQTRKQYVAPPDYEYRGRGLVYNCTGKHWACVDAPSYKTCEDNASSVKYLNKTTECYPFNVYETAKGCASMQNRMVSSSAKTNFCSE